MTRTIAGIRCTYTPTTGAWRFGSMVAYQEGEVWQAYDSIERPVGMARTLTDLVVLYGRL